MEDEGLVPRFSWYPSVLAGSYFETEVRRDGAGEFVLFSLYLYVLDIILKWTIQITSLYP